MMAYFAIMAIIIGCAIFIPKNFSLHLRMIVFFTLLLFCGGRIEVGPDWFSYALYQNQLISQATEFNFFSEPSFTLVNIFSDEIGFGIVGVNVITAFIYLFGLFCLASRTPYPWTAISVAMCYYIPALPMGIIRQAAAVGLIYIVVAYWNRLTFWQKVFIILLSSTFHLSAILMIAVLLISWEAPLWKRFLIITIGASVSIALGIDVTSIFSGYSDRYITGSGGIKIETTAAIFHWMLISMPSLWFILNRRKIKFFKIDNKFMIYSCIIAILLIFILPISSAAVTRLAMYFSYIPIIVGGSIVEIYRIPILRWISQAGVLLLSSIILVFWLSFAENSNPYKPYRNFFTESNSKVKMYID